MVTAGQTTMPARNLELPAAPAGARARERLAPIADALVAAVAVSLPWSTTATGILIVLWLIALVPTLDPASIRREVLSTAGGLPVLLWALGAIGMLWADVSWSERLAGLSGFHKLLLIPLLLAQFRRSGRVQWAIVGFVLSATILLIVSWGLALIPWIQWRGKISVGVPVKDYVMQSSVFAICAFGLIGQAAELYRTRVRLALALLVGAALFAANIVYVATARTTLVVMAVLLLLFGLRQFGWRGVLGACVAGSVLAAAVWMSSPYLRERVSRAVEDVQAFGSSDPGTSVGLRFEYWRKSLVFAAEAPVIGHGTGTIPKLFQRDATGETHPWLLTSNPHNQLLTVAIQLGLIGALALIGLWAAHLALFRAPVLTAWFGLLFVVQNIVGSLFNSFLFEFSQGWLYVFGVGVIGGAMLRAAAGPAPAGATDHKLQR